MCWENSFGASIHWVVRRLTTKSRELSKLRDWMYKWSYRTEIWQASRQRCFGGACQSSGRLENICLTWCQGLQWSATFQCQEMVENANVLFLFPIKSPGKGLTDKYLLQNFNCRKRRPSKLSFISIHWDHYTSSHPEITHNLFGIAVFSETMYWPNNLLPINNL